MSEPLGRHDANTVALQELRCPSLLSKDPVYIKRGRLFFPTSPSEALQSLQAKAKAAHANPDGSPSQKAA